MDDVSIRIDTIYVPARRRGDVKPETVDALAMVRALGRVA